MEWIVDGCSYGDLEEAVEAVLESIDESEFVDCLNETYEAVRVCGYQYDVGDIFKEADPTVFREEFNNWVDGLRDEVKETLESMEDGESETLYGVDVDAEAEEDDDEEEGSKDE